MPFVGRERELTRLCDWLRRKTLPTRRVNVISVEGPGGMGKTTFINHTMDTLRADLSFPSYGYLHGLSQGGSSGACAADWLCDASHALAHSIKARWEDVFPYTRAVTKAYRELQSTITEELLDTTLTTAQKEVAHLFVKRGVLVARLVPKFKKLAPELSDGEIDELVETFGKLKALDPDRVMWRLLPTKRRVRESPDRELARAWVKDLQKLLRGGRGEGPRRLLWIIDDYESLPMPVEAFLIEYLLGELKQASFDSVLLVVGRDELWLSHTGWEQHHAAVTEGLVLKLLPLTLEEVRELCGAHEIHEPKRAEAIFEMSGGLPLLVDWAIKESGAEGIKPATLRAFYERQTHWMTAAQKGWLNQLVFLPEVTIDNLLRFFEDPEEAEVVMDWFEQESSIRDPGTTSWTIRPFIRDRVLEHLRRRHESQFDERALRAELTWQNPFEPAVSYRAGRRCSEQDQR